MAAAGATVGRSFWMLFVSRMLATEVAEGLAEARAAGCLVARPESLMQADGQWMFPTAAMRAAVLRMEDGARRDALNESAAQLYGRLAKFGGPHLAELERFHRAR
ncbi:MAG: hypothetical protein HUU15_12775 [Candidatus Brocadiae bacterium]|nr:hypothetical protein [Candidatus Brocadiia bacterium]